MSLEPPTPDSDPIESAVTADQVAAHVTEPHAHGHHGPFHTHCENCGTELKGPYCHACGQHDFEFHRSFWHVFLEALENFFHFDSKFFRNIVTLLFRPGALTADFNAGKRASQMPPFRLYVFTAFVFFLLLFATTKNELDGLEVGLSDQKPVAVLVDGKPATVNQALDAVAANRRSTTNGQRNADQRGDLAPGAEPDARARTQAEAKQPNRPHVSVVKSDKPEKEKSGFERFLEHQGERSLDPHFRKEIGHAFLAALPKLLLVCLPLFALYTRVLFRKSGQVYLQHLVAAIHFHTFIYLWVMFRDGWVFLGRFAHLGGIIAFAANLWLFLYPFFMLRRLYGDSWLLTVLKTGLLSAIYTLTLAAGFFVTAILLFLAL